MVECNFKASAYQGKNYDPETTYLCGLKTVPHSQGWVTLPRACDGEKCILQQQIKLLNRILEELGIQKGTLFRCPKCNKTVEAIDWMIEHTCCRDCWNRKAKER